MPANLPLDRTGHTLNGTLIVAHDIRTPVVRAMGIRRHSGEQIVVARDLTHVLHVRETMINALVGGGLFCLLVSIASGLLLNLRQIRRGRELLHVTCRIPPRTLYPRLPIPGRASLAIPAHSLN